MENIKIMKITVPKPVIICIGTPRVQGDSLGPKVGDLLITKYNIGAYVYGKTSSPVTGVNCERYFEHIKTHHSHSLVIAVDACLGKKNDVFICPKEEATPSLQTAAKRAKIGIGFDCRNAIATVGPDTDLSALPRVCVRGGFHTFRVHLLQNSVIVRLV